MKNYLFQTAIFMSYLQQFTKYLLASFFILIFNFALFAQSETEPNESINSANSIAINTKVSAFINVERDKDYFKFNVTESGIITISVFEVPSNIELDVFMYTPTPDLTEVVRAVKNSIFFR